MICLKVSSSTERWGSALNNWRKFQRLARSEQQLLVQALLLLPLATLAVRWLGLKRCQSALARLVRIDGSQTKVGSLETRRRGISTMTGQIQAMVCIVRVAARHGIYRPTCLDQSLVLWWLLRRRGIESDLKIGVRAESGRFEAHAWVECDGVVINDDADVQRRFAAFDRSIVPMS